jgi:exodeoxyribonuclease V beta subunit
MLSNFTFESKSRFNLELITDDRLYRDEVVNDYWRINFYDIPSKLEKKIFKAKKWEPQILRKLLDKIQSSPATEIDSQADFGGRQAVLNEMQQLYAEFERYCAESNLLHLLAEKAGNFKSDYRKKLANAMDIFNSFDDVFDLIKIFNREFMEKELMKNPKSGWDGFKDSVPQKGRLPHDFDEVIDIAGRIDGYIQNYLMQLKYDFVIHIRDSEALKTKKLADNVLSFDDLLLDMYAAVNQSESFCELIRQDFPVVMLDEFQDTDPLQFDIFNRIFRHDDVLMVMVGDPKQSIYQFRGADIYSYLQASGKLSADEKKSLTRNYRSDAGLLAGFNTIFDIDNPFVEKAIGYSNAVPGREQSRLIIDSGDENYKRKLTIMYNHESLSKSAAFNLFGDAIVDKIVNILSLAQQKDSQGRFRARFEHPDGSNEPVRARDIAILTARNADAQAVYELLAAAGVHSTLQQSGNIFESDEAVALLLFLNAVIQPGNPDRIRSALATDFFQLDSCALAVLAGDENAAILNEWQEIFLELLQKWQERGFIQMFSEFLRPQPSRGRVAGFHVKTKLLSLPQGERRLTNLLHLGELLHQQSSRQKLGPAALIYWLHQQINDPEEREEHELRLESDESAVKIMTVHKSKGLQFPLVFCVNLWQQNCVARTGETDFFYHKLENDKNYRQYLELDVAGREFEQNRIQYRRERLSELVRLAYVALTRARNFCCFTWGDIKNTDGSALGYLSANPSAEELELLLNGGKFSGILRGWEKWKNDTNIRIDEVVQGKFDGVVKFENDVDVPPWSPAPEIRPFPRNWGIMSFSAITEGSHEENDFQPGDDDAEADEETETGVLPDDNIDLFSGSLPLGDFPRGPIAGNCIHAVFEQVDFGVVKNSNWRNDDKARRILQDNLTRGGLVEGVRGTATFEQAEAKRMEQLCNMLDNVLTYPLPGNNGVIRLCDLPGSNCRPEMQFFFPADKLLDSGRVNRLLEHLSGRRASLDVAGLRGFVNGFIDLVFESGGRYYIIDWKSNDLGDSLNDYDETGLAQSMFESHYYLQAAIYLLALDKFLNNRLPCYDFNKHIGGVFYLYVRGMNSDFPGTGVYHMLPDKKVLQLTGNIFELEIDV